METMIQISPETYQLLQRRAREMRSTPEQAAETAIRGEQCEARGSRNLFDQDRSPRALHY